MPSKFVVRNFQANGVYHIFNRSINAENIFLDTQDYRVFLFYLYIYTTPSEEVSQRFSDLPKRLREKSLVSQLNLLAYSLMPDHFHLVISQLRADSTSKLMKQVANGYTVYFNHKYQRHGPVFAGRFRAIKIGIDETLPDIVRYIHLEPVKRRLAESAKDYEWSSYRKYMGEESMLNCNISPVMNKIGTQDKFVIFHEDRVDYKRRQDKLKPLVIESPDTL